MYYSGQHRIIFDDIYDTWSSWHLVPSDRPEVKPPAFKSNYIEKRGANGMLDVSNSLTGYPLFNDREGSWDFMVLDESKSWSEVYSDIMNTIHGRKMKIRLSDDPDYYYIGRLTIDDFASDKVASKIVLNYKTEPYKYHIQTVAEQYPDYFEKINIRYVQHTLFSDLIERGFVDKMPIIPTIQTTLEDTDHIFWIRFVNSELGINIKQGFHQGTRETPRFIISNFSGNNRCFFEVYCGCPATFQLNYRNGRL